MTRKKDRNGGKAVGSRSGVRVNRYRDAIMEPKGLFLGAAGLSAAINILMLTGSVYMLQVYDRVLPSGSVPTLVGLFAVVVMLYAFLGFYDGLRARIFARIGARIDVALSDSVFKSFILPDRRQREPQALRDLDAVRGFMSSPVPATVFDIPWIPLYLGILFLVHPWVGALTVAGAIVLVLVAGSNRLLSKSSITQSLGLDAQARHFSEQSQRSSEIIKAFGMQNRIAQKWKGMHEASLIAGQRSAEIGEVSSSFSKAFRMLLQSAILSVSAYLVLQNEITAGMIIATSILSGRALAPIEQLIGQWRSIAQTYLSHGRLMAAFEGEKPATAKVALPDPTGAINVSKLTQIVPQTVPGGEQKRMLTQVSFRLLAGDGLGVIGSSASGKTTLAKLLVGVMPPDSGEIRFDGATADQWDAEVFGRFIGYLPQAVEMLPGTIKENITRFDPAAKDDALIDAAKIAGVHEMILALPKGYDTSVGPGETPLSGGQIQRLGLARAIFGNPKIVVLDEPNSNLDATGDQALARAIQTMRGRGATVIVMAHRPSALASVNKVMVLQNGEVQRFGLRDEIIGDLTGRKNTQAAAPAPTAPRVMEGGK